MARASIGENDAVQLRAVLTQPRTVRLIVGAQLGHDRPKVGRMVHLYQMGHLMRRDIAQDRRRGHNQPPRKHQVAPVRARPPARTRIAQRDPPDSAPDLGGVMITGRRQPIPRGLFQERLYRRSRTILMALGQKHLARADLNGLMRAAQAQVMRAPLKRDVITQRNHGLFALPCDLCRDPVGLIVDERDPVLQRRPRRQGQRHPPVQLGHPQRIPPRPRRTAQQHLNRRVVGQIQGFRILRGHTGKCPIPAPEYSAIAPHIAVLIEKPFDTPCHIWQLASTLTFLTIEGNPMPKEEWGVKRVCPSCSTRFYDLQRDPMICPSCAHSFSLESLNAGKGRTLVADKSEKPAKTEGDDLLDDDTVLDDDDDVDLGDDVLDDDDDDDNVSLDEIADVSNEDNDS